MPEGGAAPDPGTAIRNLIAGRAPGTVAADLDDDTLLTEGGLGLDSVAVVELLLDLEEQLGVSLASDVLAQGPLTLGRVIRHARSSCANR